MKNGSTTITQRKGNHGDHASTSTAKPNIHGKKLMCIWSDQLGVVLWVAQIERDHYWGSLLNTIDEIKPSTQGKTRPLLLQAWQNYSLACSITCCGAGQNLLRNTQMGSSIPPAVFSRHCSFRLPLVPINDAWSVWTALHIIWGYQKLYRWLLYWLL